MSYEQKSEKKYYCRLNQFWSLETEITRNEAQKKGNEPNKVESITCLVHNWIFIVGANNEISHNKGGAGTMYIVTSHVPVVKITLTELSKKK